MTFAPGIHRRQAILALVGALAAVWAVALGGRTLQLPATAIARASSGPARLVADVTPTAPSCPFPQTLAAAFRSAAATTGLPPALLYAVAKVESNLQVDARSPAGARGLLQLMPSTAASLQLDSDQPRTNVLAGARYLSQLVARFGSVDSALAAYNAGPTAVDRAGGVAPSGGVLRYVENVDAAWRTVAGCR